MSNTLLRFWLCSSSDAARIELTDGKETHQVVCSLGRSWFSGDVQVGDECPEDERAMLLAAITAGESDDDRFQGWDRSFDAALNACDADWDARNDLVTFPANYASAERQAWVDQHVAECLAPGGSF